MCTSLIHVLPGSAASVKTSTGCSASTCPRGPICRCFLRINWTTSHGCSTPGQEKPWAGKHPLNCSCPKAHSTSSNTGQLISNLLHLDFECAPPPGVRFSVCSPFGTLTHATSGSMLPVHLHDI